MAAPVNTEKSFMYREPEVEGTAVDAASSLTAPVPEEAPTKV